MQTAINSPISVRMVNVPRTPQNVLAGVQITVFLAGEEGGGGSLTHNLNTPAFIIFQ